MEAEPATGRPLQNLREPVSMGKVFRGSMKPLLHRAAMALGCLTSHRQGTGMLWYGYFRTGQI
jgi:hypothetical protein